MTKLALKDKNGVKYKHPERSCSECCKDPCFTGKENLKVDFAKYGCTMYKNYDNYIL